MKHKQKATVVHSTTNTVPLAKLSEDELDLVTGGRWDRFVYKGTGRCRLCIGDDRDY